MAKITTDGAYFSITGEISTATERARGDFQEGGCIHDRLLKAWPDLAPLVAIHLSSVEDGKPMHAEANGWYWLAGWKGGLGETYHGGNQQPDYTPEKCLAILADHVRLPVSVVESELGECNDRTTFSAWIARQSERWQKEANEAVAMIAAMP
jgi:hypothetical protein